MDSAKYAELFRQEAREHLAEIDTALLALEQAADASRRGVPGAAIDSLRDEHVATLFRATHTIKGMAAAMGYRAAERVSHALESLLDETRAGRLTLDADAVALLFDGTDALGVAIADATAGDGERERPETRAVVDRLLSWQTGNGAEPLADAPPLAAPSDVGLQLGSAGFGDVLGGAVVDGNAPLGERTPVHAVEVRLRADCPLKGVRASLVLARLGALGTVDAIIPASELWQRDDFDGSFRLRLASMADGDAIADAARAAGEVDRVVVRAAETLAAEPAPRARESARTVRIDQRRLDTLLDLVGELVITRDRLLRRVEEATERGASRDLARDAHETARLVSALQDEVLQARMVPVGQTFDRFPRVVRDIARELGKDVQFVMEGREIDLDRSLLDAIGDPILHLLRNALDHGLEEPETRRECGKPPTGRLVLRAARDRAAVVIQVEDDGRGIDRHAVMRRAVERGLVSAEAAADPDDDRLLQTLAYSGLSTARTVTAISGRGVGVDVVATRVRALGGVLSLETLQGEGTVFTMRLPATLAITRALLVHVAGETYALPAAGVVEALEFDPASRTTAGGREAITLRDEILPVLRLRERFGLGGPGDEGYVAVVEAGGRRSAILVDALVAQQDVVVKPLDAIRGAAPWFSGATVLGDGTPSLIVDLGSLL